MISSLVTLIIYLLVVGIIAALLLWLIDAIPLPEPVARIVRIAIIVVLVLIVVILLLQLVGVHVNAAATG